MGGAATLRRVPAGAEWRIVAVSMDDGTLLAGSDARIVRLWRLVTVATRAAAWRRHS